MLLLDFQKVTRKYTIGRTVIYVRGKTILKKMKNPTTKYFLIYLALGVYISIWVPNKRNAGRCINSSQKQLIKSNLKYGEEVAANIK